MFFLGEGGVVKQSELMSALAWAGDSIVAKENHTLHWLEYCSLIINWH